MIIANEHLTLIVEGLFTVKSDRASYVGHRNPSSGSES